MMTRSKTIAAAAIVVAEPEPEPTNNENVPVVYPSMFDRWRDSPI